MTKSIEDLITERCDQEIGYVKTTRSLNRFYSEDIIKQLKNNEDWNTVTEQDIKRNHEFFRELDQRELLWNTIRDKFVNKNN